MAEKKAANQTNEPSAQQASDPSDAQSAPQSPEATAPAAALPPTGGTAPTETIPGGKYYTADGKTLVNALNQPIDEEGNVLDETPLPRGT